MRLHLRATPKRSRAAEERTGCSRDLIYARGAPNNVVRFRGPLMVAAGALITTKYGPISPPGAGGVGSFRGFEPTGILSVERARVAPAFLSPTVRMHPFCGASAHIVMGVAMEVALGYAYPSRSSISEEGDKVSHDDSPMGSLFANRWLLSRTSPFLSLFSF